MPSRLKTVLQIVMEEGQIHVDHLVKKLRGKDLPRARILPIVETLQGKGYFLYDRRRKMVIATEKAYASMVAA